MSKIELTQVQSGFYSTDALNQNFADIEAAIENTLSRNGDTPNSMEAPLDMNSYPILNLPNAVEDGSPITLGQAKELLALKGATTTESMYVVASEGQIVFPFPDFEYSSTSDAVLVFVNGVFQTNGVHYYANTTNITFTSPLSSGDEVDVLLVSAGIAMTGGSSVTSLNGLSDVSLLAPREGQVLRYDATSSQWVNSTISVSGGGEVNTASNTGAGVGVYKQKVGANLEFKSLLAGSNVTISSSADSITISASSGASATMPFLVVTDFGATGDGVTDDSAAIQQAITVAKSANKALYFPAGTYNIATLGNQEGRIFMFGMGDAVLLGSFKYIPATNNFPKSADTTAPITPSAPFLFIDGVSFKSSTTAFGLVVDIPFDPDFYQVCSISNARFYGQNGLFLREVCNSTMKDLWFHTTGIGAECQAITNVDWIGCKWHNQAGFGIKLTRNLNGYGGTRYHGGENARFINCEWAVCNYGLYCDAHAYGFVTNSLFDYCTMPVTLYGTSPGSWRFNNTYIGVSNVAKTNLSSLAGYVAPPVEGIAVYGLFNAELSYSVSAYFTQCHFVRYGDVPSSNTNPVVYFDGVSGVNIEDVSFSQCKFEMAGNHSATSLLAVSYGQMIKVINNTFKSYLKSTTLTNAYIIYNCNSFLGHSNDTLQLRNNNNVQIAASFDTVLSGGSSDSRPLAYFAYSSTSASAYNAYVDCPGLSITLTPTAIDSDILLNLSLHLTSTALPLDKAQGTDVRILRNGTQIAEFKNIQFILADNGTAGSVTATSVGGNVGLVWMDYPSTTSPVTYTVQFKANTEVALNTVYFNGGSSGTRLSSMSAMQVRA
jgi:hypothetical protein